MALFADINVAAVAALQEAALCSENRRECGGVIIERDGQFYYTPPTPGVSFGTDLREAYATPGHIVADYHVHICSVHNAPFANFFSFADASVNQGLHTVGYMLSLCDHNVRRYDPAQDDRDDEEVDFKSGKVIYLTIGHIVGWIA